MCLVSTVWRGKIIIFLQFESQISGQKCKPENPLKINLADHPFVGSLKVECRVSGYILNVGVNQILPSVPGVE